MASFFTALRAMLRPRSNLRPIYPLSSPAAGSANLAALSRTSCRERCVGLAAAANRHLGHIRSCRPSVTRHGRREGGLVLLAAFGRRLGCAVREGGITRRPAAGATPRISIRDQQGEERPNRGVRKPTFLLGFVQFLVGAGHMAPGENRRTVSPAVGTSAPPSSLPGPRMTPFRPHRARRRRHNPSAAQASRTPPTSPANVDPHIHHLDKGRRPLPEPALSLSLHPGLYTI